MMMKKFLALAVSGVMGFSLMACVNASAATDGAGDAPDYSQKASWYQIPEVIKDYIMKYGPVSFSYVAHETDGRYYNPKTSAYHFDDPTVITNHAAIIVGWDDNFSKDNFSQIKPQNNGAWIVRNSWGTDWGDGGYEYPDGIRAAHH